MSKQTVDNWAFTDGLDEYDDNQLNYQDQLSIIHATADASSPVDPNLLLRTPAATAGRLSLGATKTHNYEDILKALSNVELPCTPSVQAAIPHALDEGFVEEELEHQSQGGMKLKAVDQRDQQPGGRRLSHNMSDGRHRKRINVKLRALQELIPHCPKRISEASLLERAIERIKILQHQLQMLSAMGVNGGCPFQDPYVAYQSMQLLPAATMGRFGMEMLPYTATSPISPNYSPAALAAVSIGSSGGALKVQVPWVVQPRYFYTQNDLPTTAAGFFPSK